ncbi:MAG: permease prefix domain 1-containing protein [Oscillospiraceae bacterium]|nr:permease prefix domain 1-containing protein [Oscillospiraceae bacterium]
MNERIKEHVEKLFLGAPHTRQAAEVKEELLANLHAKYDDMISQGKGEAEAFDSVISGIGDIRSLLGETPQYDTREVSEKRHKSGTIKSVAIGLMICSLGIPILLTGIYTGTLQWLIIPLAFISTIAVSVGLLIFAKSIGPKKYVKGDDTFVEEYKEKVSGNSRDARLKSAVSSTLWTAVLVIYLAVSIITWAWHVTWLIWLIGALAHNIIRYLLSGGTDGGYRGLVNSTIWLGALVLYFAVSLSTGSWRWSWLIFIVAILIHQLIRLIDVWREAE